MTRRFPGWPPVQRHTAAAAGRAVAPHVQAAISGVQRKPVDSPMVRSASKFPNGAPPAAGREPIQASLLSTTERLDRTDSYHPGGNSPSAYALRRVGIPEIYWRFIFPGGTVYRRSSTDPLTVFNLGWTRAGYDDLIRHTTVEQGTGSNWIATTKDLAGMDETYGTYAFEIELEWSQGVDVNVAYRTLQHSRNPHAEQNEVAAYGTIRADQVTAVWVPKAQPTQTYYGPTFSDYYDRYTKEGYRLARNSGLVAHPPT